jgi:predicted phage terminase large subunit-like protein
MQQRVELRPNPGPQTEFLSCGADIILYGGVAGAGKTWGLLADPLRYLHAPGAERFRLTTLRRTMPEIKKAGALWDTSMEVYPQLGGEPRVSVLTWVWPSGFKHEFGTIEHEVDLKNFQGAQFDQLQFDEITTFTKKMFLFLFSRLRTTIPGLRPCVRATCNPDPDSWVLELVIWFLDAEGDPDPKKCGRIRWLVVDNGVFIFADTRKELLERYPAKDPQSFTFIPGKVAPQLGDQYLATLDMLEEHDRRRLKDGNWFARRRGGYYDRSMFTIVDAIPSRVVWHTRFWDFAATKEEANNDPDFTAAVRVASLENGAYIVTHALEDRWEPEDAETAFKTTAQSDTRTIKVRWEEEGGSSGKFVSASLTKMVKGWDALGIRSTGSKLERAKPAIAQARSKKPAPGQATGGNILLLRGPWNERFLLRMESFGGSDHDDMADAFHGAFNDCMSNTKDLPVEKVVLNPGGARRRGGYSE